MNKLPQELIDQTLGSLEADKLLKALIEGNDSCSIIGVTEHFPDYKQCGSNLVTLRCVSRNFGDSKLVRDA